MKQQLKYRNFYKCALAEGLSTGFVCTPSLELQMPPAGGPCTYLTQVFDTRDADTDYHRLFVDCDLSQVKLEVIAAATNTPEAPAPGGAPLDELLASPEVEPARKEAALRALPHVRRVNTCDVLLHELQGRYIWVYLAFWPEGLEASCCLRGLRLEYPRSSFLEYFPEIYQQNDFFERYIDVLQTMFLDEEGQVDRVPRLLDYEGTPDDQVAELASWLGLDTMHGLFGPEQLRYMIRNIDLYQGGKGTRQAMERIVQLATGLRPRIIEAFQWDNGTMPPDRLSAYRALYGESSNHFCVILDVMDSGGRLKIPQEKLEQLITEYSMVGTCFKLVLLDRCSHTDGHCYLDVNSVLSTPEIASVDRAALGGHITVG